MNLAHLKSKQTALQILLTIIFLTYTQQKIYKDQSDRVVVIQQPTALLSEMQPSIFQDNSINFTEGQFDDIPDILYSVSQFEGNNCDKQSFTITTQSLTLTKLVYRILCLDCALYQVSLSVLASRDPSIKIVSETVILENGSKVVQFNGIGKILSFNPFMTGFKGNKKNQLKISQQYERVNDSTIKMTLTCINIAEIYFNYLVVYENIDTSFYAPLYEYKSVIDTRLNDVVYPNNISWIADTELMDGSNSVVFGFKDINLQTMGFYAGKMGIKNNLVSAKKVNLEYLSKNYRTFNNVNAQQVQLLMKACDGSDEYMYIDETTKQCQCTKSCSSVNPMYFNNPNPVNISSKTFSMLVCSKCDSACNTCNPLEPTKCLTCKNNFYLFENTCYQTQPSQTYCDVNMICIKCHESCKECKGPNNNDCLSCQNNFQYFFTGQCLSAQPANTYCRKKI